MIKNYIKMNLKLPKEALNSLKFLKKNQNQIYIPKC